MKKYPYLKIIILKHIKDMPGFLRQCYKGSDERFYVFQFGKWFSASKDFEPCCPVANVKFRLEAKT